MTGGRGHGDGSSEVSAARARHTGAVDRFVVTANGPLSGTVRAGGAKNSVLKLMAACLLAEGRHVLTNVPRIPTWTSWARCSERWGWW